MRYVLLFCGSADDARRYQEMSKADMEAQLARVGAWFGDSRIQGGLRLAPGSTATTVRFGSNGDTMVTDGPFIEGNEDIGGWAVVQVGDLDEALQMAKSWPARGVVEVRPVQEM